MIYFITVNYYSTELIGHLVCSLPENSEIPYQLLIVNNSSQDTSINELRSDSILIIESPTNLGFGGACNLGLNWVYSQDPYGVVWLINPDAYLSENSIEKVINLLDNHPKISIAGTTIYTEDGTVWFAGGDFNPSTGAITSKKLIRSDTEYVSSEWLSGCSLIINLNKFEICPQFDPAYFLYYEDFDFCQRYASQGHLVVVAPHIVIIHKPSSITNKNIINKLKHSTYSYLLTLQKHTNSRIFLLRFIRLFSHSVVLLPIKPQMAFGKLHGVFLYLRNRT